LTTKISSRFPLYFAMIAAENDPNRPSFKD